MSVPIRSSYWFLFYENQLLLCKENHSYTIPTGECPPFTISDQITIPIPFQETQAYAGKLTVPVPVDGDYITMDLRSSWSVLDKRLYELAGRASQLLFWDKHSRFCPVCGTPSEHLLPAMKKCPNCDFELYPVISTAILALVRKADQILLVRACNFRGPFHSLVAGFLDVGETLEECVAREVKEETGLTVNNITYWGNQPWPYPSGLMVGFIADYVSGEINLQEDELISGAFYSKENLPLLPELPSLARQMIDWWLSSLPNHGA
ncbi:NAD(+) diphosphatase [Parabacteroides sp. OttesenSCG-928-G07]|nr:NAD(+) diphosphatase [Parabacteroides sp. OttesenSCG-928-G07]